jgi:nicotinamide riboside transporter PnuC
MIIQPKANMNLRVDDEAYTRTIVYIVSLFCYYTWKRKEKKKEDYEIIIVWKQNGKG